MPTPDRPARMIGQETLDLDGDIAAGRRPAGRVERMVARSVDAGVAAGTLDPDQDAGAAALAVAVARAVDRGAHDPFAVAAAARELREQLVRLRLDPAAREGEAGDSWDDFVKSLSADDDQDAGRRP